MPHMHKVAIVGASGFTGAELMRICATHPDLEVIAATGESQAGKKVADLYPSLAAAYDELAYVPTGDESIHDADLVFLGLPHGASQSVVPGLRGQVKHIVDLASDFRLDDPGLYPDWYGDEHGSPELLDDFVYGLPELFRTEITGAELIAVPGCYPTTAVLGLAPLAKAGLIDSTGLIVDAATGVSGAGRPAKPHTTFCAVDEDFSAYGLLNHRHTPEMEMVLRQHAGAEASVIFTPHLAPMNRGILATCYARPVGDLTTDDVLATLHDAYDTEPFVVVSERSPSTKATLGSNSCHITARVDPRTGWVIVLSALDNLVKGASGGAVQCANLALGLPEATGLAVAGLYP